MRLLVFLPAILAVLTALFRFAWWWWEKILHRKRPSDG